MDEQEQTRCVSELAGILLETIQPGPGWRQASMELKPVGDELFVRLLAQEPDGDRELSGPVEAGSATHQLALDYQRACQTPDAGTWLTALVVAHPDGDDGHVQVDAYTNPDMEVGPIAEGDGSYTAEQVRDHLERFPRPDAAVPAWMRERVNGVDPAGGSSSVDAP